MCGYCFKDASPEEIENGVMAQHDDMDWCDGEPAGGHVCGMSGMSGLSPYSAFRPEGGTYLHRSCRSAARLYLAARTVSRSLCIEDRETVALRLALREYERSKNAALLHLNAKIIAESLCVGDPESEELRSALYEYERLLQDTSTRTGQ